jgi:TolB-like protein
MGGFLQELRQRRVWRVLVAYPGIAFVMLEAVKFFIDNYGLDARALTATIIAAVGLLPAALLWNWRHGESGHQAFTRGEVGAYLFICAATLSGMAWYWKTTPAQAPLADATPPPARSIAVMPFVNVGGDEDVQYLCDGIAESLTNWLSGVPDVRVVSKSAAFRLRDKTDDIPAIVEALGVDSVVRGRLETLNGSVMVSASLVDTRDEAQLWGERLVQPQSDVIYLERSIVSAIKDSLGLKLTPGTTGTVASAGTDNPEAYRHYLRGHYLVQTPRPEVRSPVRGHCRCGLADGVLRHLRK